MEGVVGRVLWLEVETVGGIGEPLAVHRRGQTGTTSQAHCIQRPAANVGGIEDGTWWIIVIADLFHIAQQATIAHWAINGSISASRDHY